jgi:tetratricopeptide (TPR) repeat protein
MEKTLKALTISAFLFLTAVHATSLEGKGPEFTSEEDSINYMRTKSYYKEFYKIKLYQHAIGPWWELYHKYPASSEKMYVDGAKMYRYFIDSADNGPRKEGLIDTLMLIYEQRMEYFGGEGNVLGRQGIDLFTYGRNDIEKVEKAYGMLKKSIEIEGKKSREPVILSLIAADIILSKHARIDHAQVVEDYIAVNAILDQLEGRSSRWVKTRATINDIVYKEDLLTCESLNSYFVPRFDHHKNDEAYLEKVINIYSASGCESADIFLAASEEIYSIYPGAEAAHDLAMRFVAKGDYEKALKYLQFAVTGDDIDNATRADRFYKLAIISSAAEEYCDAITYAREAIVNKSDCGKAYVALGDMIIAASSKLPDEFDQRAAYWAAADKYAKAASLDKSISSEAKKKLVEYQSHYPEAEEVFFRDMKEGDSYRLAGCINEHTTVRARK